MRAVGLPGRLPGKCVQMFSLKAKELHGWPRSSFAIIFEKRFT